MKKFTNELTGILANSRRNHLKVDIVKIPVRLMAIDPTYQTPARTERCLDYLIRNWDDNKLLPVIGVPHDEEGKIYLVDGYGRMIASQIIDPEKYAELDCLVLLNAPTDIEARRVFEAEQYAFQNVSVDPMKPFQKHGAMLLMKDPVAIKLDQIQKKYELSFRCNKGIASGQVSYATFYRVIKMIGSAGIDWTMELIRKAGFDRKSYGYAAYIMNSFRDMYRLYPSNRDEIMECLATTLRSTDPLHLKSEAVIKYPILDHRAAVSIFVEDIVVEKTGLKHVRIVNGNKIIAA